MPFSAGDFIGIAFGLIAVWRWWVDSQRADDKESSDNNNSLWKSVNGLRTELAAHEAKDETQFDWIKETLQRLERKMDNAQAQIRNMATGSNDTAFERKGK